MCIISRTITSEAGQHATVKANTAKANWSSENSGSPQEGKKKAKEKWNKQKVADKKSQEILSLLKRFTLARFPRLHPSCGVLQPPGALMAAGIRQCNFVFTVCLFYTSEFLRNGIVFLCVCSPGA